MQTEFDNIKNVVLATITSSNEEILPTSKIKKSGIYMIYINCFDDERIIPIYIGQAVDIQNRYKSHYQEILSLNRLSYETYKQYTEYGLYEGKFKSCKIFKYMIEHNCSLHDYHMIPIEYCDENELDEKEQFYINKFKSEYFGFNQLNCTSSYQEYNHNQNKKEVVLRYLTAVKNNALLLKEYWGYGFTIFNYEYAFYKNLLSPTKIKEAQLILNDVNTAILELSKFTNSKYTAKSRKLAQEEKIVYDQLNSYDSLLEPIDAKIKKQKRLIRSKFKDVLNYNPTTIEFKNFIEGMYDDEKRRLFNSAMKKRNQRFLAYVRLKDELTILESLNEERKNIAEEVSKKKSEKSDILNQLYYERKALKTELRMEYLLPCVEFQPFALKDCKRIDTAEENSVLFVASNNGRSYFPEIVAVYSNIEGISKCHFIHNQTTTQTVNYAEHCTYYSSYSFRREVYKMIPINSSENNEIQICNNCISVLSEYKTGINDYSLAEAELNDINTVIKGLLPSLKANSKIKFNCTESKNILIETLKNSLDKRTFKKITELKLIK